MDTETRLRELAALTEAEQMRLNVLSIAVQTLITVVPPDVAAHLAAQLRERAARLIQDHAHFVAPLADSAATAELNVLLAAASRSGPT
jgi:hypothetical protein